MEIPKITIKDIFVIQVFICYLIDKAGNLTEEQFTEIITEAECVNQFEFIEAFRTCEEKNLIEQRNKQYFLLTNGKLISDEFEIRIPLSIKEHCTEFAKKILARAELEKAIKTRLELINDDYFLIVTFLNEMGGADIMEIKIYAPTKEIGLEMQNRFYERPTDIITKVLNLFIKDSFL